MKMTDLYHGYEMGLLGPRSSRLLRTADFKPHPKSRKGRDCLDIAMFIKDPRPKGEEAVITPSGSEY